MKETWKKLVARLKKRVFRKRSRSFAEKQQAEVEYRMQLYAFKNQKREIERKVDLFEQMAVKAERENQHANALLAMRLRRKLAGMQGKIEGVILNYEILHSLGSIGESMNAFMQGCGRIGLNLQESLNQIEIGQSVDSVQEGLARLDSLCNAVDQVIDIILRQPFDDMSVESTPEDEEELARMVGKAEKTPQNSEPLTPQQAQRVERLRMGEQA